MSKETNIWCENHNEFLGLMKILHLKGYEWACGNSALEWDPYSQTYHDDDRGVEIEITSFPKTIRYGFVNHNNNISFTEFKIKEGIEVNKFTKADLKDGMVVKVRKGIFYMYFQKWGRLVSDDGHLDIKDYNEDLTLKNLVVFDIVQVYELNDIYSFKFSKSSCTMNLIWERPVEVVMTISEIEEKLGIKNLKVVSEKEKDNG